MKKILVTYILLTVLFVNVQAQFGIGVGGGLTYPGFTKSKPSNTTFGIGFGYDIMVRHRLIKLTQTQNINARYFINNYFSQINLEGIGRTDFEFNYFGVYLSIPFNLNSNIKWYLGAGVDVVNISAAKYVFEAQETLIVPEFISGLEYWFGDGFNLFSQLNFQYGNFATNLENMSLSGLRLWFGGTIFFLPEEF